MVRHLTDTEVLEFMALSDFSPEELQKTYGLSDLEKLYLRYCRKFKLTGGRISNEDYEDLRLYLMQTILKNTKTYIGYFNMIFENRKYSAIIDVGAGHLAFCSVFQKAFPGIRYFAVDKCTMPQNPSPDTYTLTSDIFEYFDRAHSIGNIFINDSVLIFISDFLHCKKSNMKLLTHPAIMNCDLLIRENLPNINLKKRLEANDGCIVSPEELIEMFPTGKLSRLQDYTFDDHYFFYVRKI